MENRNHYEELFKKEFNKLNYQQKEAVETIENPVMVIAGPGTGKTQVLSLRIAQILKEGVCDAENILCLTYSESGSLAMQKRLSKILGPTASQVSIHTFHSFCNRVIYENPSIFKIRNELELAETIDQYEIIEVLLFNLDESNLLYKHDRNYTYDLKKIHHLFKSIKEEYWDIYKINESINKEIINLKTDDRFIYKRNSKEYKKGDLKQKAYDKEVEQLRKTQSVLELYPAYVKEMKQRDLYDFNDLILNVISEFQINTSLKSRYQEKFQYLLVDEFQDTNGSQFSILKLLTDLWKEESNIFVVGDGDQAIYRFQGANIANLREFEQIFKPKVIELRENYRSTQSILNLAEEFIQDSKERFTGRNTGALHSNSLAEDTKSILITYDTANAEYSDVSDKIELLISNDKVDPVDIAVLFRNNKDAELITKELSNRNIPFSISKELNVIEHPLVHFIMKILEYIEMEYSNPLDNEYTFYEILHAPFIKISALDIALIAFARRKLNLSDPNNSLRKRLSSKEFLESSNVSDVKEVLEVAQIFEILIKEKNDHTVQKLIENIFYQLKVIHFITSTDNSLELMEVINSFYEYVKALSIRIDNMTISDLVQHLNNLKNYNLNIPFVSVSGTKDKIRLSTLHSAKGLEYKHVFIVNAIEKGRKNSNSFKLPPGYSFRNDDTEEEDERRLYYVGITRAKEKLQLSYSTKKSNGKDQKPIDCIRNLENSEFLIHKQGKINEKQTLSSLEIKLSPLRKKYELLSDDKIEQFLETFSLSVTSLEKYLQCPLAFYYEKVLRVPGARSPYMGFGRAIHSALEDWVKNSDSLKNFDSKIFRELIESKMRIYRSHFTKEQFDSFLIKGQSELSRFIQINYHEWGSALKIEPEVNFKNQFYKGVPLSGKLDRIDEYSDGIVVIDYKTGNSDSDSLGKKLKAANDKNQLGGEYWRQMVFYSILNETSKIYRPWKEGIFYFVISNKKDEFVKKSISITEEDKSIVKSQIVDTYAKIVNKEFTPGCQKPECIWCSYLETGVIRIIEEDLEEEDYD
ncbi:MAG: ATP-dependent helicase [Saprospiraceae bacterium]|nr:ATP-dependent helicase [Saprospiraceae bacterium]